MLKTVLLVFYRILIAIFILILAIFSGVVIYHQCDLIREITADLTPAVNEPVDITPHIVWPPEIAEPMAPIPPSKYVNKTVTMVPIDRPITEPLRRTVTVQAHKPEAKLEVTQKPTMPLATGPTAVPEPVQETLSPPIAQEIEPSTDLTASSTEADYQKILSELSVKQDATTEDLLDSYGLLSFERLSIGIGYPYLSVKYDLTSFSVEGRVVADSGIRIYSGRGYWNLYSRGAFKGFTGLELGYIKFNLLDITGSGLEGGAFVGGEYRFNPRLSLLIDFAPTVISLRDANDSSLKVRNVEFIVNLTVYFHFRGAK